MLSEGKIPAGVSLKIANSIVSWQNWNLGRFSVTPLIAQRVRISNV